jgi:hypothetical protein
MVKTLSPFFITTMEGDNEKMAELPLNIRKSIGKYEPIKTEGLTLYPIKVEEYYEFMTARPAIEFMQQRLPVHLMSEPLLSAYFKLDTGLVDGEKPTGLFASALLALALALRLKPGESMEERTDQFRIIVDPKDHTRLKSLRFRDNGEERIDITPVMFQRLRPIIAAQNGIELRSDLDNPELVDAENDLAAKSATLDMSVEGFVHAAALVSGKDESEIYGWEILKMHDRLDSARRVLDYLICGIGESQGSQWKGGNPAPSPWFARLKDANGGVMPIESFAGGQGIKAIQEATANKSQ